jgi:hypothetical protein
MEQRLNGEEAKLELECFEKFHEDVKLYVQKL